jgi:hypothetical protein
MISSQNYVGRKQNSFKIIKIKMFTTEGKARLDVENVRGLNLAAVKHTTV